MRRKTIQIIIVLAVICLPYLAWGAGNSDDVDYTSAEMLLLEKINTARTDPIQAAIEIGITESELKAQHTDFYNEIKNGLPLLVASPALMETASDHTIEMASFGYFSKDAVSGETFEARLDAAGYLPGTTGESIGSLMFSNYISIENAIELLYTRLLKKAFDGEGPYDRNIFSPDFTDIGIGIGAGSVKTGGVTYNAYYLTCDFGEVSDDALALKTAHEALFLSLVNQVRQNPLSTAASMGIDFSALEVEAPNLYNDWLNKLPVMAPGETVCNIASELSLSYIRKVALNQFTEADVTGDWKVKRILKWNNSTPFAGFLAYRLNDGDATDIEGGRGLALNALVRKLTVIDTYQWGNVRPVLLAPDANQAGITVDNQTISTIEGNPVVIDVVVFLTGKVTDPGQVLMVQVFYDRDKDGLFKPGEEASDYNGVIYSGSTPLGFTVRTDITTSFFGYGQLTVSPGAIQITGDSSTSSKIINVTIREGYSNWVPLIVQE